MKTWDVAQTIDSSIKEDGREKEILALLLASRGIEGDTQRKAFLSPKNPFLLTCEDVGINKNELDRAIKRIRNAVEKKESIVVYADYDADGVTACAVMWEGLHALGARIMPYIPSRADEGYGLSEKGIDYVHKAYSPSLIITVDHGITGKDKVSYGKNLGIDFVVTDHHVKPKDLPDCPIVHTVLLSGAGISWFLVKELFKGLPEKKALVSDLLGLATIGTVADMIPLTGINRSLVKHGLSSLQKTGRQGIVAMTSEAGIPKESIGPYDISHVLAPRINAMGRLDHALDSLRLLCTKDENRAHSLSEKLGSTNKERQQLTFDMTTHAKGSVMNIYGEKVEKNILIVSHESYNQGVIGLVAGKLVEAYYRPSIVIAKENVFSKASARSIPGFNIIDAIRSLSDLLVDAGGHPMAAGFTIETKNIEAFVSGMEELAGEKITKDLLLQKLRIDIDMPLSFVTETLWEEIQKMEPFGFGNPEPVFSTRNVSVIDAHMIGNGNKHLKLKVRQNMGDKKPVIHGSVFDAIAFGMGELHPDLTHEKPVDIAYTIDMNEWNGRRNLQLKIKDVVF